MAELPPVLPEAAQVGGAEAAPGASPDWQTPEDTDARRMVFLVTLAAVLPDTALAAEVPLRTLDGVTREHVKDAVLDAVAHVGDLPGRGRPRSSPLAVTKLVVFQEDGPRHFHVAVKLTEKVRFLPLKSALRIRSGFASHWSTVHSMFWSACRYGVFETEHKPLVDASPLTWTATGEQLNLFQESQEPFMANVLKRRREEAESHPQKHGKARPFTKLDLFTLVIAEKLETSAQVLTHVQTKGSATMQHFLCRNQGRLAEYIKQAWAWDAAPQVAEEEKRSGWDIVIGLAREPCSCCTGGPCPWQGAAQAFFERNRQDLDSTRLAACLAQVMQNGPSKTARVPLLAGPTNAGKSTIFDPIDVVFGETKVFHTPALGSAMPLANLALCSKRFMYLDDFRPVDYAATPAKAPTVPVVTFLKLLGGQSFEVQVSQSFQNGNVDVRWQHGVCITAKSDGLWHPMGAVSPEDVAHMQSRVEQFVATAQIPAATLQRVPPCKTCFCRWVVTGSASFVATSAAPAAGLARGSDGAALPGFDGLMDRAGVTNERALRALRAEILQHGAAHVSEVQKEDWATLAAWELLGVFEQRRLLAAL